MSKETETDNELVERVARAISKARCSITGSAVEMIPSDMLLAQAAVEAILTAGKQEP